MRDKEKYNMFRSIALPLAFVSGFFFVLFSSFSIANYYYMQKLNPGTMPILQKLRIETMQANATQEKIEQFREIDLFSRDNFYQALIFSKKGATLLLASFAVFIFSLIALAQNYSKKPVPLGDSDIMEEFSDKKNAASIIFIFSICILAFALFALYSGITKQGLNYESAIVEKDDGTVAATNAGTIQPPIDDAADFKLNWPFFRGPTCDGISPQKGFPQEWDTKTGKNIRWKITVSKKGNSSPVVWKNKIFLTGADSETREVYCLDLDTGNPLWTQTVDIPGDQSDKLSIFDDTGYAASSMAIDGRHAVAIFANGDIACLSHDGKTIWKRKLGLPENPYGYASSPLIYRNIIIIQFDNDKNPSVLALNLSDGSEVWKKSREVISCWSSPIIATLENNKQQLILNGNPYVAGYVPESGNEIWRTQCLFNDLAISPTFNKGLVLIPNGSDSISAYSIAESKFAWSSTEDVPDVPCPLATEEFVFTAAPTGIVNCYDLRTGSKLWTHAFETGFYSSPTFAEGKIYLSDRNGKTHVLMDKNEFSQLSGPELGEPIVTVPAFMDGKIIIRGSENIYCIGTKE